MTRHPSGRNLRRAGLSPRPMTRTLLFSAALALSAAPVFAQTADPEAAAPAKAPGHIRLFQMNIWNEGTPVKDGFEKIADVIAATDADIVTLSEVRTYQRGNDPIHERLVKALAKRGKTYHAQYAGGDMGLLSRFPIAKKHLVFDAIKSDSGSLAAWELTLPGGKPIVVASAHLDYKNYAVYPPRGYDGNSFKMIDADKDGRPDPVTDLAAIHKVDAASQRDEALRAFVDYAKTVPATTPLLLAGDFNECSHLDWTKATADKFGHNGVVIEWKNSKLLADSGFVDGWRHLYPDPATHLGATWPSTAHGKGSTSWAAKADERDRIDFVYHRKGGVTPVLARIVGPREFYVFGKVERDTSAAPYCLTTIPWPTDHKGVLMDYALAPATR